MSVASSDGSGSSGRRHIGFRRGVRGVLRCVVLFLSVFCAALLLVPAVSQSGDASPPAGSGDIDRVARTLMSGIVDGSRVALLPLDRRVGLPEEAHRRFYDALANALGRSAKRGIRMVSGPRQRAIYRHLVETYEKDLDAELKSILQSAQADFVVICLWKRDDPGGFELSCAPSGVETIERLDGGDVRFHWESEAEYLEFVVARLARNVLGNRDVGGVQKVRMHDRRFGGRTELTDFVTGLLQQEAMEVAGERGFPGTSGRTGWDYRLEGEVWHWGRGRRPVINVSWEDAQEYVRWLSRETGEGYRLLSEAEWEYVARGGTRGPFHFGTTITPEEANYDGKYTYGTGRKGVYREKTVPVGSFPANGYGLHDVHGNVREWVEDCWHDDYRGAPADGSGWTRGGDCGRRVLRGGSWDGVPQSPRSAYRCRSTVGLRNDDAGFRVARTFD